MLVSIKSSCENIQKVESKHLSMMMFIFPCGKDIIQTEMAGSIGLKSWLHGSFLYDNSGHGSIVKLIFIVEMLVHFFVSSVDVVIDHKEWAFEGKSLDFL